MPVLRNLASPRTDLRGFFNGLSQAAAATAPVAVEQAELFKHLDETFAAFARVAYPYIQESISEGPETLDVATASLPNLRTLLNNSADLFTDFQPAINSLADASPDLASLVEPGDAGRSRALPAFNQRIASLSKSLEKFSTDPLTNARRQGPHVDRADPRARRSPSSRRRRPSATTSRSGSATSRACSRRAARTARCCASRSSRRPAARPPRPLRTTRASRPPRIANGPAGGSVDQTNYLHSNPYPFTAAPGQPRTCEAANEKFLAGKPVIGNVPGQAPTTLHDDTTP